jgi:hypothetical protein
MTQDIFSKSGLECALDLAAQSPEGVPWAIPYDWARELITNRHLKLTSHNGDISGEASAFFEHDGETLRLKRDWKGHYSLFHGRWRPDPHWTGD